MAPSAASSEGITAQSDLGDNDDTSSSILASTTDVDRFRSRQSMFSPFKRSILEPRREALSKGGIAGVVIGIILFFALAVICAYPFVVRRVRKGKRNASLNRPDTETAFVPGPLVSSGQGPATGPGTASRLSSGDSLGHKADTLRGTERQSTKEMTLPSHNGIDHSRNAPWGGHQQHDVAVDDRTHPPSATTRRDTDHSFGRATTWKSEASYPWTPVGIELVATRADGLEYSDATHGHSAAYYSSTIPSEAFGMITPPPTDEPSSAAPPPRRSSSRASSLKTNLFGMLRRMSTKDSTTTRSKGYPTQTTSQVLREGLSDSPTELGPPTRELVPSSSRQLASPFAPVSPLSETGETDVAHDSKVEKPTESPPVLPPIAPAPGTVNPMDIMAPSNSAEHNWHTDRQLYHIAHPPPKPAEPAEKPAPTPEPSQALTPQSPELPFEQHQQYLQQQQQHQLHKQQLLQDQQQQQQQQWQQTGFTKGTSTTYVNGSAPTNGWHSSDAEQDIRMNDGPHLTDHSHLAVDQPYYRSSFDGNMTDPSDHSPAMAGHASSRASYQTTPNTLIDSSPSPRSDDSLDIRNSTSPYPGLQQSPRSFMCDECGRFFDQVHKLNHHKRYHERPHECAHPGCGKRFGTKTHLDRHINDKHKKTKKFHCTVSTCLYSKAGGKSFPRKDNWRRHMVNIHHVQPTSDPEPDMVDEAMGGT